MSRTRKRAALNLSKSGLARGGYRADMASYTLDFDRFPQLQFRIDSFTVPIAARQEFENAMTRNLAFIETLPGFQWHQIFEKVSGPSVYNLVTIAVWESPEAMERAIGEVRAYYDKIGFSPAEAMARWGAAGEVGNYRASFREHS